MNSLNFCNLFIHSMALEFFYPIIEVIEPCKWGNWGLIGPTPYPTKQVGVFHCHLT